jgi:hypothetical protein
MSAEPLEPPIPTLGRVHRVPRTIRGIRDRLPEAQRERFLSEAMAAEFGPELTNVLAGWHAEAMLSQVPDRAKRRERAIAQMEAGRKISIDELRARRGLGREDAE